MEIEDEAPAEPVVVHTAGDISVEQRAEDYAVWRAMPSGPLFDSSWDDANGGLAAAIDRADYLALRFGAGESGE